MSDHRSQAHQDREAASVGLAGIEHIVAVGSGKGGVGKSTVTVNLAAALQERGLRVGVLDADIYGPSQPGMLGAVGDQVQGMGDSILPNESHGLRFVSLGLMLDSPDEPVIWRAPIAMKVLNQFLGRVAWGELDYLLIDLPPGTGDVQLTLAQQARLTGAVVVTTPQHVALGVARRGLRMFDVVNVPTLGIIENMSGFTCSNCDHVTHIFASGGGEQLATELGLPFLGALPLDPEVVQSGEDGVPVVHRAPTSAAALAFRALAAGLVAEVAREQARQGDHPTEVILDDDGALKVVWSDGHQGRHTAYDLRVNCPCAGCVDEDTGRRTLDPGTVPLDVRIQHVQEVGRYALAFAFSDGHDTGIYRFGALRERCECDACIAARGDDAQAFTI
jgi:ATP-binding protein involved in chromosome partitioning